MIKYRLLALILLVSVAGVFNFSCTKENEPGPVITKNVVLPASGTAVVDANNQFAFDFLNQSLKVDQVKNNKLISPLSIYLALSMVYNGADKATRDSIRKALKLENISIDDLNKTCQALMEQIPDADNKVNMSIANSIWYDQNKQPPVKSFLDITNQFYHAEVRPLNFASNEAVKTINNWVSDKTHEKITSILDQISDGALMFLINAIYFKGTWQYVFDKNATQNQSFRLPGNNVVSTPFMSLTSNGLNYFANDAVQMVQLPYGGGNFNMYVLLPKNDVPIETFISGMNASSFQSWQSQLHSAQVNLYLPKFKYSYAVKDMKPALSKMGMGISFTEFADFSKMYTNSAQITEAIHKTFIEVNEEGTEAAAVTAIGVGVTSVSSINLNIDRPFMYIIAEKTSNTILFTGIVNNPAEH